jgi:hypothetical protein
MLTINGMDNSKSSSNKVVLSLNIRKMSHF